MTIQKLTLTINETGLLNDTLFLFFLNVQSISGMNWLLIAM